MKFPLTINDSQATDKTPTSRKSKVCERAERAIELLEFFSHFHIKTLLFLSIFLLVLHIFCRYERKCMSVHIESEKCPPTNMPFLWDYFFLTPPTI